MSKVHKVHNHGNRVVKMGNLTEHYYHSVFGPEFTQELVDTFGKDAKYLIREFLFGVDCMIELINDPSIPSFKFLNNEDVDERLVTMCQMRARTDNISEYYGCQVGPRQYELISEFFEYGYLRIFHYLCSTISKRLVIPVDGKTYSLFINEDWASSTSTSVMYFRDESVHERRISIPFKRKRLLS